MGFTPLEDQEAGSLSGGTTGNIVPDSWPTKVFYGIAYSLVPREKKVCPMPCESEW